MASKGKVFPSKLGREAAIYYEVSPDITASFSYLFFFNNENKYKTRVMTCGSRLIIKFPYIIGELWILFPTQIC